MLSQIALIRRLEFPEILFGLELNPLTTKKEIKLQKPFIKLLAYVFYGLTHSSSRMLILKYSNS